MKEKESQTTGNQIRRRVPSLDSRNRSRTISVDEIFIISYARLVRVSPSFFSFSPWFLRRSRTVSRTRYYSSSPLDDDDADPRKTRVTDFSSENNSSGISDTICNACVTSQISGRASMASPSPLLSLSLPSVCQYEIFRNMYNSRSHFTSRTTFDMYFSCILGRHMGRESSWEGREEYREEEPGISVFRSSCDSLLPWK